MQTPTFGLRKLLVGHTVLTEKKARTEAVASIRACVVVNRHSEPILPIQILQYIERLLSRIASGRFLTQHGGILASKAWVGNARGPGMFEIEVLDALKSE